MKYRERTIEYRREGHTLQETSKVFKVSITTIRAWEKQWEEEGNLKPKKAKRSFKKIVSAPVIKCKKTPRKKCSFMAEEAKKR